MCVSLEGVIDYLEPIDGGPPTFGGTPPSDHPMRVRTRAILDDDGKGDGGWTATLASEVGAYFDQLAIGWTERFANEDRAAPLRDAHQRGGSIRGRRCLELGSGTGLTSGWLAAQFSIVVAVDLSRQMLLRSPSTPVPRVCADGAHLPFASGSFDTVALVNMFLFPSELHRILPTSGAATVIWVSSAGPHTPIYLAPEDVESRLPGAWNGTASTCGESSWCVLRRVNPTATQFE